MPLATDTPSPEVFRPANEGRFGLLPAASFRLTTGLCQDCETIPQALWFFRHDPIAVPLQGQPVAGFSRTHGAYADLAGWHAATPPGSALDYPPLVWTGADQQLSAAKLAPDGTQLHCDKATLPLALAPRHPLNRSYFNELSTAFFSQRSLHVRGHWNGQHFIARTLWPEDFRLPETPSQRPLAADPLALRERVRAEDRGGARSTFSVENLWQKTDAKNSYAGRAVLAFILNGAQGDDDEAHGGHFAAATGYIGKDGAINDWLVANYYTLDSESEKGIIAAPVPLDNYFADLNSGQAWYRPSCMLVAVLREQRTAAHIQSALGRIYNQFYRHQFSYQHARANCAGITISTLRTLDWQVPARGPEGWLKAIIGLPVAALTSASLRKGKAVFDYFTEDQTRLYPAAAFEEIGADLLHLAQGTAQRQLSTFETMLAEDIDALLLVRIPQLPSSRARGNYAIVNSREYHARVPKKPADRQIVPVGPRPFPKDFVDPEAPSEPPLRSDYAVAGYALLLLAAAVLVLRALG
ncbi:MAG: hypothetical protein WC023_06040 [Rhodocyclaceae bacterium]